MAQGFFSKSHFLELGIALQEIPDDEGHLDGEDPVFVLFFTGLLEVRTVADIFVFLAVLLGPFERFLKLLVVVDAALHSADDLYLVYAFAAHAQVVFKEVRVHDGTGNAHADGAYGEVGLAPEGGGGHGAFGKAKELFLYVGRDGLVVCVLDVVPVNAEGGKALLGMGGQYGGQIHGAGALGSVEAPDGLDGVRIHVHGLRSIAPARGDGNGDGHALPRKLFCAGGGLCHAANGGICYDALHGGAVFIAEFLLQEGGHGLGHAHGLVFQGLAYAVHASVNGGADAYLGMVAHKQNRLVFNYSGVAIYEIIFRLASLFCKFARYEKSTGHSGCL